MRRRAFFALLGGTAATWPLVTRAQQPATPVIGFLSGTLAGTASTYVPAFEQGLAESGYSDGKNVRTEYRWADGIYDRLPALAADLVSRKVDVIAATGGNAAVFAARKATSAIPVVFATGGDPIDLGLVSNLGRPGGNLTGFSFLNVDLYPKRLQLLCELVPEATVVGLLVNPTNTSVPRIIRDAQEAARSRGVQLVVLKAGMETELDSAFAMAGQQTFGGLIVAGDAFLTSRRDRIVALAARYAVRAIYQSREFADRGGLISYGANQPAVYRQVGSYCGRILKGEKVADLPVQQSATFEMVVNLRTAKVLNQTVPQSILVRANEVIE